MGNHWVTSRGHFQHLEYRMGWHITHLEPVRMGMSHATSS
jgi:hypothetical protein